MILRFEAKPRDHDTVDVFCVTTDDDPSTVKRTDMTLWLVFTCSDEVAKTEHACWIAITRTGGSTRSALDYLVESWQQFSEWAGEEWVGKLIPDLLIHFTPTKQN